MTKKTEGIKEDGKVARRPRRTTVKAKKSRKEREEEGEIFIEDLLDENGLMSTQLPDKVKSNLSPAEFKRITARAREHDVLKLVFDGLDFAQIAEKVGYANAEVAKKTYDRVIQRHLIVDTEQAVRVQIARLDRMLQRLEKRMAAGDLGAFDRAIKIEERRAKLLGLDAAEKREYEHRVDGQVALVYGTPDEYVEGLLKMADLDPREEARIREELNGHTPTLSEEERLAILDRNKLIDDEIAEAEIVEENTDE